MIDRSSIDVGVLDPERTEIYGPDDGYHVLLRGQRGGPRGWPYRPEVVQRRTGQFGAVLNVTLLLNADGERFLAEAEKIAHVRRGWSVGIRDFQESLLPHQPLGFSQPFDLFLIKMLRPAAPQGVEWNAPGGIAEAGESSSTSAERELREEAGGLEILAQSLLCQHLQFSSGVYREWYDIYAVLARGEPHLAVAEGALETTRIPLTVVWRWIREQQSFPPEDPRCCWVDGKILLALTHPEFWLRG